MKRKITQPLYIHEDYHGTNSRLDWILFIQDRWNIDFISAEIEFESQLIAKRFTNVKSL